VPLPGELPSAEDNLPLLSGFSYALVIISSGKRAADFCVLPSLLGFQQKD
jgi:hypothetical protein